mgnify:FL=1|tara:strand:+ start:5454 stop:7595 length:2142 start_codon:yes stop_codon:yes gene_type:complete
MTVNYEIKSQLARLLATEDLLVENRNVATAQFNVETRVLTLPMWKRASENVYDMLVGHEVGHALYTPNEWDWSDRIPHQFVNVVEDARIEKLMKRRYPGLSKSFYKGYSELAEDDFFCLEGSNISDMNLADRANLYYKIGNFVDISFSKEEERIVKMMGETETFADALMVAEELYRFCKDAQKLETPKGDLPEQNTNTDQQGTSDSTVEQESGESSGSEEEGSSQIEQDENTPYGGTAEQQPEEPKVTTDEMFEEGTEEFNGNLDKNEDPMYCEVPKVKLEHFIIPNADVHQKLNDFWESGLNPQPTFDRWTQEYVTPDPYDFGYADCEFGKFKKSAQKEINYMVKEFECKKSADAYARSATARTGVLDCSKLHTYKYNEDLFRKVTILPDGKNHGLIFVLDWSGSMGDCIVPTVKQLLNIVWFCNKVNIPFDVYAFTNNWARDEERRGIDWSELDTQENEVGMFNITGNHFGLMNILSSSVKKSEVEKQILNLWRVAFSFKHWVNYSIPGELNLSGTPLHESLVCLHQIIPQFKSKHGVQKTHCVILTDGESGGLPVFKRIIDYKGVERLGVATVYAGCYLRNRKTGHTYKFDHAYYRFTDVLLKDLRQSFPETNFIGIRLCNGRELGDIIRRYEFLSDEQIKKVKKVKSYAVKESGYTSLFTMLSASLENISELDVEEGASKTKIKSAFMKNLKAKALNKKVLSQFMDLVC